MLTFQSQFVFVYFIIAGLGCGVSGRPLQQYGNGVHCSSIGMSPLQQYGNGVHCSSIGMSPLQQYGDESIAAVWGWVHCSNMTAIVDGAHTAECFVLLHVRSL